MITINNKVYNDPAGPGLPYWRQGEDGYMYILPNTTRQNKKETYIIKEHKISYGTFYKRDIIHTPIIVSSASQDRLEISHKLTKAKTGTHLALPTYLKEGLTGKTLYDHKDSDPTNDSDENLRVSDRRSNSYNKKLAKNNTLGYKGVHFDSRSNVYPAWIVKDGKAHGGRTYKTAIVAGLAYNELARIYHGEFAGLNKIAPEAIISEYNKYPDAVKKDLTKLDATFGTSWSALVSKL